MRYRKLDFQLWEAVTRRNRRTEKKVNDLEFRNIIGNRIMKKKELFEFCNSCGEYKQHIRTASNIIRCKICGHGNWTAWNEEFESKNKRLSRNKCLIL